MKKRHLLKIAATVYAATMLVGCGRVITEPILVDPNGSGYNSQIPTAATGTITGRVVDARTKMGLSGVTLTLMGSGASGVRSTVTNGSGEFTLTQVPASKQKLTMSKTNYTYMVSNGDVIVDVVANTTVTAPDIALTESGDAVPNAFNSAFTGIRYPQYLSYDKAHNYLYTTDKTNPQLFGGSISMPNEIWEVRRLDTKGATLEQFGGETSLLYNEKKVIYQPMGMSCDSSGNLYLADPSGLTSAKTPIKRYGLNSTFDTSFTGLPGVGLPLDIQALRDGFAVITTAGKVMIYNSALQLKSQIPVSSNVAAIAAESTDALNTFYIIDNGSQNGVIKKFDLSSSTPNEPVLYFGQLHGRGPNQFEGPTDLAIDPRNGDIYVVDSGNNRVVRYSSQGTYLSEFGGMGSAAGQFNKPTGIAIDADGYVYIADTNNHRIQKFNPSALRQVGQN